MNHTRLLCLELTILPPVSWPLVCLIPSLSPRHFQPAPPTSLSLTHFFFHQLCSKIACIHLQCYSLYSLSTLFPVGTVCLVRSFAPLSLSALFRFKSLFLYLRYTFLRVCVSLSTVPAASSLAFLLSFSFCFHYVQQ